jgi:hypothetical protein
MESAPDEGIKAMCGLKFSDQGASNSSIPGEMKTHGKQLAVPAILSIILR